MGFHEVNARRSDFAFASAAAQIAVDGDGVCRRLALGVGAVTPVPLRLDALGQMLEGLAAEDLAVEDFAVADFAVAGMHPRKNNLREAVAAALADIDPLADLHASANYRRRVAGALAVRAIMDANAAAGGVDAR